MPYRALDAFNVWVPGDGPIGDRVTAFLCQTGYPNTAKHSTAVAAEARCIAGLVGADENAAETAGWLHDISAVISPADRVIVAECWGLDVLPEELRFPPIIHQKLSVILAKELFEVNDPRILSAIGCHTTLKPGASQLDKVVFVADKIAWDQPGDPPYRDAMPHALDHSLDAAALIYLEYLWQQRDSLPVLHPWAVAAYRELTHCISEDA